MAKKDTPVRLQYLEIKRQYPDAILFFRLGDFYETFDDDAEITARELDIVLTSRNVAKGERVPMAGIPHHAAENYIGRLIEKGHHVAICEQVGDGPIKGLFPRQVVRVITPGTVVEPGYLPGDANNYLTALVLGKNSVGIAYADISTGEFAATELISDSPMNAARIELTRLMPAEVLASEGTPLDSLWSGHRTLLPDWKFDYDRAADRLQNHFKTSTLQGFGLGEQKLAVQAAGAILEYLNDTQQAALPLLNQISSYTLDEFMTLDAATRRNLEITETLRRGEIKGSLLGSLDVTITPMGRRQLRQWLSKPLLDIGIINARLDQVEVFFDRGFWRAELRETLVPLGDLERLTNRTAAGIAGPRDLTALRELLTRVPAVLNVLETQTEPALQSLFEDLDPVPEALSLLQRALVEEPPATLARVGIFREGYSDDLDAILSSSRGAREWIANLEGVERARTGIKTLKVGFNKVFGYYIEVTKAQSESVPEDYIRKQTLVHAERYITPELKDYEALVLNAEERIHQLELDLFRDLCSQIAQDAGRLLGTARALAHLDTVAGLAEVAAQKNYVRPEMIEDDSLEIREGRHPVVEEYLENDRFTPNETLFEDGERIRIITGPNMSGKSTYLRQVALIVLMAQIGSFVPAHSAKLGITDRIFTRIGAQDEIHAGQSTFMVEMVETANILNHATARSLLILDEIGRGTSTFDGLSIAWAVIEFLHNHPKLRSRTLFATHYHELTRLTQTLPGVRNYNVAVSEKGGDVVFLHKIISGKADKSYGIHVAMLAGLPKPVVNRAREILDRLESESNELHKTQKLTSQQLSFFPESIPLLNEIRALDIEAITPLEALNKLYEWSQRFGEDESEEDNQA
jgi:DNA mismatch repair protein MutS